MTSSYRYCTEGYILIPDYTLRLIDITISNIKEAILEKFSDIKIFENSLKSIRFLQNRSNANFDESYINLTPHQNHEFSLAGWRMENNNLMVNLVKPTVWEGQFQYYFADGQNCQFTEIEVFRTNNHKNHPLNFIDKIFKNVQLRFKITHADLFFNQTFNGQPQPSLRLFITNDGLRFSNSEYINSYHQRMEERRQEYIKRQRQISHNRVVYNAPPPIVPIRTRPPPMIPQPIRPPVFGSPRLLGYSKPVQASVTELERQKQINAEELEKQRQEQLSRKRKTSKEGNEQQKDTEQVDREKETVGGSQSKEGAGTEGAGPKNIQQEMNEAEDNQRKERIIKGFTEVHSIISLLQATHTPLSTDDRDTIQGLVDYLNKVAVEVNQSENANMRVIPDLKSQEEDNFDDYTDDLNITEDLRD